MNQRRVVVVIGSRYRWHEIGLCATALILAVLHFCGPPIRVVPDGLDPWYAVGGFGGLLGLIGVFIRKGRQDLRLKTEQAGLMFIAAAALVYGFINAATVGGYRSFVADVSLFCVWFAPSLLRAWQIRGELRQLRDGTGKR